MMASDHVISIRYCDWLSAALQNGCANKEHQTNYSQSGGVNSHSVNYLGFTSFLTNIVVTNIFKCKFYIHMIRKKGRLASHLSASTIPITTLLVQAMYYA